MANYVPIRRTFTPFSDTDEVQDEDFEYWSRLASLPSKRQTWEQILRHRLVVILGEARSGKTEEFRQQARCLRAAGKSAFFIRLDELATAQLEDSIDVDAATLRGWLAGSEEGYFFLDAVDEARLLNATALRTAIARVRRELGPMASRIHVLVSSRISDWMSQSVRDVFTQLGHSSQLGTGEAVPPAYQIDPLERDAVIEIADKAHHVRDRIAFWRAVEEGGYEPYARRPGDLEWLVARWNQTGTLGSLAELTEAAILQRLSETNDAYITAGAVLPAERLLASVRTLAAASVLSGRPQILAEGGAPEPTLVNAAEVLDELDRLQVRRVLGTALFDVASLGRVRFHHRAVREYLAAAWVEHEIAEGLPVANAINLFVAMPFGERVLIRSRRGVLCWLATFNADVRDYVIRHFPEMVMFEGDPTRWAQPEAIEAFERYLERLAGGFWQDWWNDAIEYARVAAVLPAAVLDRVITCYADHPAVLAKLFTIIAHGRKGECAASVYRICADATFAPRVRTNALWALQDIATTEQRDRIRADLVAGKLWDSGARAAALACVGLDRLSREELSTIFKTAPPAPPRQSDPLLDLISRTLLRELDHAATMKLLAALYDSIPEHRPEEIGTKYGDERTAFAWLLEAFVEVFQRAVTTFPSNAEEIPSGLVQAALLVEALHHTEFLDSDDLRALRHGISRNPQLRRTIAKAIGLHAQRPYSRLTGIGGIIRLDASDREWVITAAMDASLQQEEREVWFHAALELTYATSRGARLRQDLAKLVNGPDADSRKRRIASDRAKHIKGLCARREFHRIENKRRIEERERNRAWAASLETVRPQVADGSHIGALVELVNCARRHGCDFETIDPEVVRADLDAALVEAFKQGMERAYKVIAPPDWGKYIGTNEVPWTALIGLSSACYAFRAGLDEANASEVDVVKAMHFAAWSLQGPRQWMLEATQRYTAAIANDLMPVIEAELTYSGGNDPIPRFFHMALRCGVALKTLVLDRALQLLCEGRIAEPGRQRLVASELHGHVGAAEVVASIARDRLEAAVGTNSPTIPAFWLQEWLRHDVPGAWAWARAQTPGAFADEAALALAFATAVGDFEAWAKDLPSTPEVEDALKAMFRFVVASFPFEHPDTLSDKPIDHFVNRVPGVLASLRTPRAHAALRDLADDHAGSHAGHWLRSVADNVAAEVAERAAIIKPLELRSTYDVFTRDAQSEAELLQQVESALEEVRRRLEVGPYSDRGLFHPGMDESLLQKFLAARLDDAPVKRFKARYRPSRESEVDLGNKPDIEVTAAAGRVPVEVKPVDKDRYSANDLIATLRNQLLEKYLARGGSRHGALVVFKLEEKTWEIPGGPRRGSFGDLIGYLKHEAEQLRINDPRVGRLVVIGIDCTVPVLGQK